MFLGNVSPRGTTWHHAQFFHFLGTFSLSTHRTSVEREQPSTSTSLSMLRRLRTPLATAGGLATVGYIDHVLAPRLKPLTTAATAGSIGSVQIFQYEVPPSMLLLLPFQYCPRLHDCLRRFALSATRSKHFLTYTNYHMRPLRSTRSQSVKPRHGLAAIKRFQSRSLMVSK